MQEGLRRSAGRRSFMKLVVAGSNEMSIKLAFLVSGHEDGNSRGPVTNAFFVDSKKKSHMKANQKHSNFSSMASRYLSSFPGHL
jgi:hypothetical protein